MHGIDILSDLVLLLGGAIPVVVVARRAHISPIVGFLLVGVVMGPGGMGWIDRSEVADLAEVGVVLLLFTIGLELSLSELLRLGRSVLMAGALQVGGTMFVTALVAFAVGASANEAIFYGALAALSSTAVVLKVYAERGELEAPHGRMGLSILLFQDLAVVPLMLAVPLLGEAGQGNGGAWQSAVWSLLVVAVLVVVGRWSAPKLLERVAALRDRELFTLSIGFLILGAAFVASSFGLSLALGAFVAGLVISESDYGLQALSDVRPFRDLFVSVFFASVGMLIDVPFFLGEAPLILTLCIGTILGKALITTVVVRAVGRPPSTAVSTGVGLAQVGEFSLLLAAVGQTHGLLEGARYQVFLGVSILSLVATPFLIQWAPRLARALRFKAERTTAGGRKRAEGHAILVGYGLTGQQLGGVLASSKIPFVVVEANRDLVRRGRDQGHDVVFGDGASADVLESVGVRDAKVVVFAISSPADERRAVSVAKQLNPQIGCVVRTRFIRELEPLYKLGASDVVVEEYEATLEVFARVLGAYGIDTGAIHGAIDDLRAEHYSALRGSPGTHDDVLRTLEKIRFHRGLELVSIGDGAQAVGESPTSLRLRSSTGAAVVAVLRHGRALYSLEEPFRFRAGDEVVLVGEPDSLAMARHAFSSEY